MEKKWTLEEAQDLFALPFPHLMYQAQTLHRQHFSPEAIQVSARLSIKTGSCPENCSYCPQSAHYQTGLEKEPLMVLDDVLVAAQRAKEAGATRFCMGAAWRGPRDTDLDVVCTMVQEVKKMGLETCVTLGLLKDGQAEKLKAAGLDFYNHNIDTSPAFYEKVITTRSFQDRLNTLSRVQEAGVKVCCGGILGMGETSEDRILMLLTLANMTPPPESVPLNKLMPFPGTPLADQAPIDGFEFVRTVALARILMPTSFIRLSAGRQTLSDELQALCFLAGANSIFYGEKLLTAANPAPEADQHLFHRLGLRAMDLGGLS